MAFINLKIWSCSTHYNRYVIMTIIILVSARSLSAVTSSLMAKPKICEVYFNISENITSKAR